MSTASTPTPAHGWSLAPGHVEAGRYRIVREIGRGGMGVVYEAEDAALDRPVALKLLSPELTHDEAAVRRFDREALAVGRVGHPNICDVRDRGRTADGAPFIVMELLEGEPHSELLDRVRTLDVEDVVDLLGTVLSALQAAHRRGVVHRDLKPANIFLTRAPDGDRLPKLVDFGIAKRVGTSEGTKLTAAGTILGTPQYMSPEQARGVEDVGPSADLWAVGVIAYECLTGEMPFAGRNALETLHRVCDEDPLPLRGLDPSIPAAIEAVVLRALQKDPAARFPDAASFATSLAAAADGAHVAAAPPPPALAGARIAPSPHRAPLSLPDVGTAETAYAAPAAPAPAAPRGAAPPPTRVVAGSGALPPTAFAPPPAAPGRVELPDIPPPPVRSYTISVRAIVVGAAVLFIIVVVALGNCLCGRAPGRAGGLGFPLGERATPAQPQWGPDPYGESLPAAPPLAPHVTPQPPIYPAPQARRNRASPASDGPEILVRLVGIPPGARVTYDGRDVTDGRILGRLGDSRDLELRYADGRVRRRLLTIEVRKVVDVGQYFAER